MAARVDAQFWSSVIFLSVFTAAMGCFSFAAFG